MQMHATLTATGQDQRRKPGLDHQLHPLKLGIDVPNENLIPNEIEPDFVETIPGHPE